MVNKNIYLLRSKSLFVYIKKKYKHSVDLQIH